MELYIPIDEISWFLLTDSLKNKYVGTYAIHSDPLFMSTEKGDEDFRLQRGSPALNKGLSEDAPKVDIEGNPRPSRKVDIGAYEMRFR